MTGPFPIVAAESRVGGAYPGATTRSRQLPSEAPQPVQSLELRQAQAELAAGERDRQQQLNEPPAFRGAA